MSENRFGHVQLPREQATALRAAIRIEWWSLAFLLVTVIAVMIVMGSSQAMKAAWLEDSLSFAPPIAFLVAARIVRSRPTASHPYGRHRAVGIAHLVAGVALSAAGLFLMFDSVTGLLAGEHPPIGTVMLFGHSVWAGWLMMGVMAATIPAPVILGHKKMQLAEKLHDKVLYADADMNKADWMTAVGTIVGVAGIGAGLWWADAAAAIFIAVSILKDGATNLRSAITDLMDTRATTYDGSGPNPTIRELNDYLRSVWWVAEAGCRVRDQGHVLHVEAFVVPRWRWVTLRQLERARQRCIELDWKVFDIVMVPVLALPEELGGVKRDASAGAIEQGAHPE